jgi:DNA-binding transcriptional ArsR family regulator
LQLLEDEGLVTSVEDGGKRRFQLTDEGKVQAGQRGDGPAPWEEITAGLDPTASGLREAGILLLSAVGQFARAGSREQFPEATAILDEARRRIYGLLADTPTE